MTSTLLISHTPLHSQGNKQNSSDYRPVSLTFIVSKLLKQMINSNIVQHLEAYHLLSDHQYGFCCSRLCETLLITLLHDLCHCYDRNRLKHSILCHTNSFYTNWNGMAFGKRWKTGSPHFWIVGTGCCSWWCVLSQMSCACPVGCSSGHGPWSKFKLF